MKKVKTILASLVIMLASAFASACSCGGDNGDVVKVYPSDITIKCLTETDTVHSEYDENSGILDITCHLDDRFIIEYTLTPENTNATQVNWAFSVKDLVEPYKKGDYTRAKSTIEKVEFIAKNRSKTNYQTTLTFSTFAEGDTKDALSKKAICNITVYDKVENLSTFARPTDLDFKTEKLDSGEYVNMLTWSKVREVYKKGSQTSEAASESELAGLRGYELTIIDEDGEEFVTNVGANSAQYPSEAMLKDPTNPELNYRPLEDGKTYSFKVKAIGDNANTKSGGYSEPLSFYKLTPVTDMTNKNGVISFTTTPKTESYKLQYLDNAYITVGCTENSKQEKLYYSKNGNGGIDPSGLENARQYQYSVVCYPTSSAESGYYLDAEGVRLYPSNPSKVLKVQKFAAPTLKLQDNKISDENFVIALEGINGGIAFDRVTSPNNRPHNASSVSLSIDGVSYASEFGQKFRYNLYRGNSTTPISTNWTGKITTIKEISLQGLSAGSYKLKVEAVGNDNTITGATSTISFNILPDLKSGEGGNIIIDGDYLNISTSYTENGQTFGIVMGSVDLFFVNAENSNKYYYKKLDASEFNNNQSYDLSKGEITPGTYNIYGKANPYIQSDNNSVHNATSYITSTELKKLATITIASAPVSTSAGVLENKRVISWEKVTGYDNYKLYIGQASSGTKSWTNFEIDITPSDYSTRTVNGAAYIDVSVEQILDKVIAEYKISNISTKAWLEGNNIFQFQVATSGEGKTGNHISSIKTNGVKFENLKPVNNIQLANEVKVNTNTDTNIHTHVNNYLLRFEKADNSNGKYIIGLNLVDDEGRVIRNYESDEFTASALPSTSTIEVDLGVLKVFGKNDASSGNLSTFISKEYKNTIYVIACGSGSDNENDIAYLMSYPTGVTFDKTSAAHNLSMTNANGTNISWDGDTDNYIVNFYFDGKLETTQFVKNSKTADVLDVLNNHINQVVEIRVQSVSDEMFDGNESASFFATRIGSPTLSYASGNKISWDTITNAAGYNVTAYLGNTSVSFEEPVAPEEENGSENGGEVETLEDEEQEKVEIFVKELTTTTYVSIPTFWDCGTYKICVEAVSNSSNDGGTSTTPYVVSSAESTINVYLISQSITVSVKADGKTLSWNDIVADANEKLEAIYKVSINSSEPVDNKVCTFDASTFAAGITNVVVTPEIDYLTSGVIFKDSTKPNKITKLTTPTNLRTAEGNLYFEVVGMTETDNDIIPVLYVNGSATPLGRENYEYSSEKKGASSIEYEIILLSEVNAGELTIIVELTKAGTLTSEKSSDFTAIKIAAVTDFEKVGDYLQWTAVEGATIYEIRYKMSGDKKYQTKQLIVEPIYTSDVITGYKTYYYINTGTEEAPIYELTENPSKFGLKTETSGSSTTFTFKYLFDESEFKMAVGDLILDIRPLTTAIGYYSGNLSKQYKITKANANTSWIDTNGVISFTEYNPSTDVNTGSQTPVEYIVNIYRVETKIVSVDDDNDPLTDPVDTEVTTTYKWTSTEVEIVETPVEGGEPNKETIITNLPFENYLTKKFDLNELTGYLINEDGEYLDSLGNVTTDSTKYVSKAFTAEGSYQVEIQFLGNGDNVLDSASVITDLLTKGTVNNLTTNEGILAWTDSNTTTASSYTIEVVCVDGVTRLFDVSGDQIIKMTSAGTETKFGVDTNLLTYVPESSSTQSSIKEGESSEPTGEVLFAIEAGKNASVRIRFNFEGNLHSNWSEVFYVHKYSTVSNIAITSASGSFTVGKDENNEDIIVNIGDPIITWENKDKALPSSGARYEINYLDKDSKVVYTESTGLLTDLKYPVNTELAAETYTIQIRVIGNTMTDIESIGFVSSDYAQGENKLNFVSDVSGITVNNGTISWAGVTGANAYRLAGYTLEEYNSYIVEYETYLAEYEQYLTDKETDPSLTEPTKPVLGTPLFTKTINDVSLDFSQVGYSTQAVGGITVLINALTDYSKGIVAKDSHITISEGSVAYTNSASFFKPTIAENYKVTDGMLNWKIPVSRITDDVDSTQAGDLAKYVETFIANDGSEFVSGSSDLLTDVLNYITRKINGELKEEEFNTTLEDELSYILKTRLDINGTICEEIPTKAKIVNITNEVTDTTTQTTTTTTVKYIDLYFDVVADIRLDDKGQEKLFDNGEYVKGKYVISISQPGNTSTVTPVVNSGYTKAITAFKPDAPSTWTATAADGTSADVVNGDVQWQLSTTALTTSATPYYHQIYKFTAHPIDTTLLRVSQDVTSFDNTGNKAYKNIVDVFGAIRNDNANSDKILYNKSYRIAINVKGTADSDNLPEGDKNIYLNSNVTFVGEPVEVLDVPTLTTFAGDSINWTNASENATGTKLYIYGPFDNLNAAKTNVSTDWNSSTATGSKVNDTILAAIRAKNGAELNGVRYKEIPLDGTVLNYSLTNDTDFSAGGYIIDLQQLGNGKGVISSGITSFYEDYDTTGAIYEGEEGQTLDTNLRKYFTYEDNKEFNKNESNYYLNTYNKLGTVTPQEINDTKKWVGTKSHVTYRWDKDSDTWISFSDDNKSGIFVWSPVPGANAYKVNVYKEGQETALYTTYTRETRHEIRDNSYGDKPINYNEKDTRYYIEVVAIRTSGDGDLSNGDPTLKINFFSSDICDDSTSTSHLRLDMPTNFKLKADGIISWDSQMGGDESPYSEYRTRINNNVEESMPNNQFTIAAINAMQIDFDVKSMAKDDSGYLNSSYCNPFTFERLSDPQVRFLNGQLLWEVSESETGTILTINGETIADEETRISHEHALVFTDILSHNEAYNPSSEKPAIEYEFTVQYPGSSVEGFLNSGTTYYIASNTKTVMATKLATPEVNAVTIDGTTNASEGKITWGHKKDALGYRVRAFSSIDDKCVTIDITIDDIRNVDLSEDPFEIDNDNKIYFKIDSLIGTGANQFNISEQGGEIFVYVQSLGSGIGTEENGVEPVEYDTNNEQTNTLYLSSSFAKAITIGVPPTPTGLSFDKTTGAFNWTLEGVTGDYGAIIKVVYTVTDTDERYTDYWEKSIENIANYQNDRDPYGVITSRELSKSDEGSSSNGQKTFTVTDTIFVANPIVISSVDGKTYSYQLRTMGNYTSIAVTAISAQTNSTTAVLGNVGDYNLFTSGDGSSEYPYIIKENAHLDNIQYFMNSSFSIESDISGPITWTMISGTFTGTINGNNHTISNIVINGHRNLNAAMFEENAGTIENLNLQMTIIINDASINSGGTSLNVATVAITNTGAINNVNIIEGSIIDTRVGTVPAGGHRVGGLVVSNKGTISVSSVNAVITALNNSSINNSINATVGGIANQNTGTIEKSNFAGTITANNIGGIVLINAGTIDKCYVDNATLNSTDIKKDGTHAKGSTVGGIVASMESGSLTNSYSKAKITITKESGGITTTIGGLVASISVSTVTIQGCYVKVDVSIISNTAGYLTVYAMMQNKSGESSFTKVSDNYYVLAKNSNSDVSFSKEEGGDPGTTITDFYFDESWVIQTTKETN